MFKLHLGFRLEKCSDETAKHCFACGKSYLERVQNQLLDTQSLLPNTEMMWQQLVLWTLLQKSPLGSLVHKLSSKIAWYNLGWLFPAVFLHASLAADLINETILGFQLNPIAVKETLLFDHLVTLHHLSWDWSLFMAAAPVTQWGLAWFSVCTTLDSQTRSPYCLSPRLPIDVSGIQILKI